MIIHPYLSKFLLVMRACNLLLCFLVINIPYFSTVSSFSRFLKLNFFTSAIAHFVNEFRSSFPFDYISQECHTQHSEVHPILVLVMKCNHNHDRQYWTWHGCCMMKTCCYQRRKKVYGHKKFLVHQRTRSMAFLAPTSSCLFCFLHFLLKKMPEGSGCLFPFRPREKKKETSFSSGLCKKMAAPC